MVPSCFEVTAFYKLEQYRRHNISKNLDILDNPPGNVIAIDIVHHDHSNEPEFHTDDEFGNAQVFVRMKFDKTSTTEQWYLTDAWISGSYTDVDSKMSNLLNDLLNQRPTRIYTDIKLLVEDFCNHCCQGPIQQIADQIE
jgi:hypothetical protein